MTTCGGCGATLRPGTWPDCCAAASAAKQQALDAKTISDLRGHVGSLQERVRRLAAELANARAQALEEAARMLERSEWQHYAACGTNAGLVAAVRALAAKGGKP